MKAKEFDKKFVIKNGNVESVGNKYCDATVYKQFIQTLLDKQKEDIKDIRDRHYFT